MTALREKCFHGWPSGRDAQPPTLVPVFDKTSGDVKFSAYDFDSQPNVTLRLYLLQPASTPTDKLDGVQFRVLDEASWQKFLAAMNVKFADQLAGKSLPKPDEAYFAQLQHHASQFNVAIAFVAPRGIGPTRWTATPTEQTHIRRRSMLLGQTLDGMRVWDLRRAIQALRTIDGTKGLHLALVAEPEMSGVTLYATIFEPTVDSLSAKLPKSHRNGPDFINVLKYLDLPQAVAMAAEKTHIGIHVSTDRNDLSWRYPLAVASNLGWNGKVLIHFDQTGDLSENPASSR
jgi:hypothetical protein